MNDKTKPKQIKISFKLRIDGETVRSFGTMRAAIAEATRKLKGGARRVEIVMVIEVEGELPIIIVIMVMVELDGVIGFMENNAVEVKAVNGKAEIVVIKNGVEEMMKVELDVTVDALKKALKRAKVKGFDDGKSVRID